MSSGHEARVADLKNAWDIEAVGKLRHAYFSLQRNWVTCNGSGEETDHYDPFCQHLAVFHNDHILAYMRLLPWQPTTGFMLEHDFTCLLTHEQRASLIHENSAELSRLVLAPAALGKSAFAPSECDVSHTLLRDALARSCDASVSPLPISHAANIGTCDGSQSLESDGNSFGRLATLYPLFKLFFHTARRQNIQTFYIVVEPPILKLLQRKFGIPFIPLGKPYTFPDGTVTQAAFTTLADTERSIAARFPQRYAWYQQLP